MKGRVDIQGEVLRLRTMVPEDVDFMLRIENNPAVWEISNNAAPYTREEVLKFVTESTHRLEVDGQLRLLMERTGDATPVGFLDLLDYSALHRRAEVGILVDEPFRRQGYAREALRMIHTYMQTYPRLHQLYAYVPKSNEASHQLFLKSGYQETALLKDWVKFKTGYQEVYVMQQL